MKRNLIFLMLLLVLFLTTGCNGNANLSSEDAESHNCESLCLSCGGCLNEDCAETACQEKCSGVHQEDPYSFLQGSYITTEDISVDTGTLVFDIGENIYVPGNLEEMGQALEATIEKVSGQDFDGAGFANDYDDGKVHANVTRESLHNEQEWYTGLFTSEVGDAYADPREHALLSPGDLFLGNSKAAAHELAHVMMWRQSEWNHSQLLNEGFAEYTAYLTMQAMDQAGMGCYMDRPTQCLVDMWIDDYEVLYAQPLEYWFENTLPDSGNGNYVIGFRFMAYLHQVYGDYSKWITAFEEEYPCGGEHGDSSASQQIEVLKLVYGEDVLDNFYPWLRENETQFDDMQDFTVRRDFTNLEGLCLYPKYDGIETNAAIRSFTYQDLYINIDSLRQYVETYKGGDASNLVLYTSQPVQVNLYKADGTYTSVMTNSEELAEPIGLYLYYADQKGMMFTEVETVLSLEGISYIKLVGAGQLDLLEVYGNFTEYHPY